MNFSLSRFALFIAPATFAVGFALTTPACTGQPTGCTADSDCDGQRCVVDTGECVECIDYNDCEEGGGCCNGACVAPATFEDNCGCQPAVGAAQGSTCEVARPICTADKVRATGATLADASCDSPCDPSLGGTLSAVDNTQDRGYDCTCSGADDDGTCNVPFLRADGLPHRGSDLCAPNDKCTCYNGPLNNDGCNSLTPDCDSNAGCINLHEDTAHCGMAGNDCAAAGSGLDDGTGTCIHGGCMCDQASDCTGTGANTDSCQFVGDGTVTQCVCDDYTEDGEKAACPMQLECVAGGCRLDGAVYSTLADLLDALDLDGISVAPEADGGN